MKVKNHYKHTIKQYAARLRTSLHFELAKMISITSFKINESRFEILNDYAKMMLLC